MSHRRSGPCHRLICLHDDRYDAFIHASNSITLHSDQVATVEMVEFAYGTSWKSRRQSWMRIGQEVALSFPKTIEMIYMPFYTG